LGILVIDSSESPPEQLEGAYAALASHYRFAPMFCMPARGQEKGDVERTVFALQRRFATPVPQVADLDALNRHLLTCCLKERNRTVSGRSQTIGQMFEQERLAAEELPVHPFDACIQYSRQADKYQSVLFEDVRYSVPRSVAFAPVTVKAYPEQIAIVHKGEVVARHRRSRSPAEPVLEPTHFLAVLERKPAYLNHTKLFKELQLPASFALFRARLAKELGDRTGTRHYIRVLQLLGRHSAREVALAIDACLCRPTLRAEFVEEQLRSIAPQPDAAPVDQAILKSVHVPPPDLRRFDELLSSTYSQGDCDVRPQCDAAQEQPQDTPSADDAGGVCQALA
jgi:hypothetical protein